ncbi:hypothetical protein NQ318_010031 [Aromia moschata]|uniref:ATP-dependent RNA helicase n=1 Tax=Aromia moschata TaxID=1265417 RepID=A0AAV8YBL2_9CUCU|nr:hypothetical protein NQ318_010031 [Aromia moschata]
MKSKKNIWRSVDTACLNAKDTEGLIGIEECVDYDIDTVVSFTSEEWFRKKDESERSVIGTRRRRKNARKFTFSVSTWQYNCRDEKAKQNQKTFAKKWERRRDILGASETGSGKTLAFGLPILTGILDVMEQSSGKAPNRPENKNEVMLKPLYALVLTPTRELAFQVKNHLESVAKYTGIKIAVIVGGMAAVKQERLLAQGPEVVVATPGRLWELIQQGNPHLSQIEDIRFLAIDETDRMLEKGHFQELHDLLEKINLDKTKKVRRQNFVFSATLTLVHELPQYLKSKIKKRKKVDAMTPVNKLRKIVELLGITDPKIVDISQGAGMSATLTECKISCDVTDKDYYVYYFLMRHPGRTLIFCNSIGCVRRLCTLLGLLGCQPLPLHASMQQRQRLKSLERFRDINDSVLIATDVAARGLDIPRVQHVLHYQTPRTSESYIHRSGRTARASQEGITVLLIAPDELQNYLKICMTLAKSTDLPAFPVQENYLAAVKRRINLAREIDKLQLQVRKTNSEAGWFKKMAEEMDIIVDVNKKYDAEEGRQCRDRAEVKRKQLSSLLSTPLFPADLPRNLSLNVHTSQFIDKPYGEEKAIDTLKNAIESNVQRKKRISAVYRIKKRSSGFEVPKNVKSLNSGSGSDRERNRGSRGEINRK